MNINYLVYLRVKEGGREWKYNTIVSIIDPPTEKTELETTIWLRAIAQNPNAKEVEIISYDEALP